MLLISILLQLQLKMPQAGYFQLRTQLQAKKGFITEMAQLVLNGSMERNHGWLLLHRILYHISKMFYQTALKLLSGMMENTFMIMSSLPKLLQNLRKLQLLEELMVLQTKLRLLLTSMDQLLRIEMAHSIALSLHLNLSTLR